ncbi:MAG: DOMON-like domain-containing protein [Sphingomonadales bacterium]|nr:DOMON-like domain-containing protein [Sphingomonadales bacterium]
MDNILKLLCHKETQAKSIKNVAVEAMLSGQGQLSLRYHVDCHISALETGHPKPPMRTDRLWESTCFEIFLRGEGQAYIELNFAPSGQWAAYHFTRYRGGMTALDIAAPQIALNESESRFALEAGVQLPKDWTGLDLQAAISCVCEETDGVKSYWALAHNYDRPDFHDQACFTKILKAAGTA